MVAGIQPQMLQAKRSAVSDRDSLRDPLELQANCVLAGGIGWFVNRMGITAAGLESIEIMLSDSTLATASEKENPDLFWALKGGGSNFGIVCRLIFENCG